MAKLTLGETIDDLVDRTYAAYEITDGWTSGNHRRVTDKVKRHARNLVGNDKTIGEALTFTIRQDAETRGQDVDWHLERFRVTAEEMAIDLGITEQAAKQAHHEMIDNERLQYGIAALGKLDAVENIDGGQRYYARYVVLSHTNARAVFDEKTSKRVKGSIDVAAEKTLAFAEQQVPDMSDDERSALEYAINVGRKALRDAIDEHHQN